MAMPDYVEHRDGATEIGRLSAEAVVREYEAAAKDIEALGAELVERVKQCEAMSRDVLRVTDELKETANRYREEAKRVFIEIESCSKMTSEVSKICGELRDRIAPPVAADKSKTKKVANRGLAPGPKWLSAEEDHGDQREHRQQHAPGPEHVAEETRHLDALLLARWHRP